MCALLQNAAGGHVAECSCVPGTALGPGEATISYMCAYCVYVVCVHPHARHTQHYTVCVYMCDMHRALCPRVHAHTCVCNVCMWCTYSVAVHHTHSTWLCVHIRDTHTTPYTHTTLIRYRQHTHTQGTYAIYTTSQHFYVYCTRDMEVRITCNTQAHTCACHYVK